MRNSAAMPHNGGITGANRDLLALLHRTFGTPFTVAEAASAIGIERGPTRELLGYLSRRGWLARVRQGLYLTVPLDASTPGEWVEDPWIVASKAFSPCYIGGWSAAEHWGLTEQVFRDLVVMTARETRRRDHVLQGMPFVVPHRSRDKHFGLQRAWRRGVPVDVSDASRTLVDMLDDPAIGGGIRHVASVVEEYFDSEHRDDGRLVAYGDRLGNRSVFKRLGWIGEVLGLDGALLEACTERRSSGLTKLDPTVDTPGRIVRRWGLRVNVELAERRDDR